MEKDPVCAMAINVETADWSSTYEKQTFYFCSLGCKDKFDKEPDKFFPRKK